MKLLLQALLDGALLLQALLDDATKHCESSGRGGCNCTAAVVAFGSLERLRGLRTLAVFSSGQKSLQSLHEMTRRVPLSIDAIIITFVANLVYSGV